MLELQALLFQYGIEIAISATALVGGYFALRKKKTEDEPKGFIESAENTATVESKYSDPESAPRATSSSKWNGILKKTRDRWFGLSAGEKVQREQLEEALLGADVGYKCSQELLESLDFSKDWSALQSELSTRMSDRFLESSPDQEWPRKASHPHVILIVGVNGVGKTTSIAKLSRELKLKGHSVLLAAGDTFRAAAAEQLATWAERLDIPCIKGGDNADSSAVLFDAIKAGQARGVDFVICDSAGRLHNNDQLMENLNKNKRVIDKALPGAPHDIVLVLDANTGQNMLNQGKKFLELGLTALILTKIDGSAKGGAVFPLVRELKLPVVRVGIGEGEEDMLSFDSSKFSKALVGLEEIQKQ